jgi:hypothetical protein
MYLRETRRKNRDGSTVSYLQLAHNERHPGTGASTAKVIHSFGRAQDVDREALSRLVSSISRFLTPEQAATAAATGEVEVVDSRRLGGAWTLDRLWERLGIGAAITKAAFGHSKDFRTDLPQVVIAMGVTADGGRCGAGPSPSNTADTSIIRTIKDDLVWCNLRRMVWVANRGFASAANRACPTRGGGHYIHAEKLRQTNTEATAALARPGRYAAVAGNLRVKEVHVAPGGVGDGDGGARAVWFVICHNPEQAERDACGPGQPDRPPGVSDRRVRHVDGAAPG